MIGLSPNMRGVIVPASSLGLSDRPKGSYVCNVCFSTFDYRIQVYCNIKNINTYDDCPFCSVSKKSPTPKLTQEQIDIKKQELKERLKR
jgi:hypothetical protein